MNTFIFTKLAEERFFSLPTPTQKRVIAKLKFFKTHPDIFTVLKKLYDVKPATHRLRIGDYRLILELKSTKQDSSLWWILDIGHRADIYK